MKKVIYKLSLAALAASFVMVLSACGGGGGGSAPANPGVPAASGSSTAATVTITGHLSDAVAAKPSSKMTQRAISSWANATVQVVDTKGAVVNTGTVIVNPDGGYTVPVPTGSNYFIRVQAGNLVLKAFVPAVSVNATVNVNVTTTAEVLALAKVVGIPYIGEPHVDASSAFAPSAINITAVMTQIHSSPGLAALATALAAEIASGYNASSTTASLGSASVSTSVTAAASAVTADITPLPAAGSGILANITLTPSGVTLSSIGETKTFTAAAVDSYGMPVTGVSISWSSSDAAVATVGSNGTVTAVAIGTCAITATGGGISGSATVTVADGGTINITIH